MRRAAPLVGILFAAALSSMTNACADSISDATCPTGGTSLTWQNFGRQFFVDHCQSCHSPEAASALGTHHGGAHDIPAGFDFSTVENVRAKSDHIYLRAAGDNTSMPPGPNDPLDSERAKLGEWLACGAP